MSLFTLHCSGCDSNFQVEHLPANNMMKCPSCAKLVIFNRKHILQEERVRIEEATFARMKSEKTGIQHQQGSWILRTTGCYEILFDLTRRAFLASNLTIETDDMDRGLIYSADGSGVYAIFYMKNEELFLEFKNASFFAKRSEEIFRILEFNIAKQIRKFQDGEIRLASPVGARPPCEALREDVDYSRAVKFSFILLIPSLLIPLFGFLGSILSFLVFLRILASNNKTGLNSALIAFLLNVFGFLVSISVFGAFLRPFF